MSDKNLKLKIEKMILMENYVNTYKRNKDDDTFKNIFIMHVNDLDLKLKIIKEKKTKKGRKVIYDNNSFFYYSFIELLENGQTWVETHNICSYSTFFRKFKLWTINNVFINVYKIFINFLKNNKILSYADLKNTYIDSSNIRNKHGIDCIERNYTDKGKNGTKISSITTQSGIPLSLLLIPCNVHDVKTVIETVKNSSISLEKTKLGGDKGYISKNLKDELYDKYNISLITCVKKIRRTKQKILYDKNNNIKTKENIINKSKFLKKRIIIENMFSWIKNNKRLQIRYDKYYKNFESFVYLSFIKLVSRRFNKQYFIEKHKTYPTINQRTYKIYINKILKQ